jgi:hypothetical protein
MNNLIRVCLVTWIILINYSTYAQSATFYLYSWSNDGSRFIVGVQNDYSFVVTVYNEVWQPLASRSLPCCSVTISPDGKKLLTGGQTSEIIDTDTLQTIRILPISIGGARWSLDSSELALFRSGPPGVTNIYSATDGRLLRSFDSSDAQAWNWPLGPVWSPDERLVASGTGNQLAFLDASTGGQVGQTLIVDGAVNAYTWSSDGTKVAISLRKQLSGEIPGSFPTGDSVGSHYINSIVVVDVATGNIRTLISGFRHPIFSMVWSPDDSQIATWLDGNVAILDPFSGDIITSFVPTMNAILIGYSPSGTRLILGFYNALPLVDDGLTNHIEFHAEFSQMELNGLIEIIVPIATLDRFMEIATSCGAPTSLTALSTSLQSETAIASEAQALEAQLDALPEGTIPASCEADLRAIVQAIVSEQSSP